MMDIMYWLYAILFTLVPIQILFKASSRFRFYAKVFMIGVAFNVLSLYVIVRSLPRPGNVDNCRYAAQVIAIIGRMAGMKVVIEDGHHVPDTPCVMVGNHQSVFDLIGVMEVRPPRCALVAKQEVRFLLIFGVAAILIGTVFVNKRHSTSAISRLHKAVDAIRNDKISLFVYPEGTRNRHGGMLSFKKGAFHVAIKAQVPIVPIVLTGYKNFYSSKLKRFDAGTLTVTCLPAISTQGLKEKDVDALCQRVRQQMLEVFNQRN